MSFMLFLPSTTFGLLSPDGDKGKIVQKIVLENYILQKKTAKTIEIADADLYAAYAFGLETY